MNRILLYIATIFIMTGVCAQSPLHTEVTSKIDRKKIKIDTADRVFDKAIQSEEKTEVKTSEVTFDFDYNPLVATSNLTSIVAIYRLKIAPTDNSKQGFVRAGIGNYLNTLLDVYYGSKANSKMAWSIGYNHLGGANGSVEKRQSGYSDNKLSLHGKYFMKNVMFSATGNYRRTVTKNYGFFNAIEDNEFLNNNTPFVYSEAIVNPAQDIHFDLGFKTSPIKKTYALKLNVEPRVFVLNDSTSSFDLNINFDPEYKLKSGTLKLQSNFQNNTYKSDRVTNRSLLHFRPSFEYSSSNKKWIADIGFIVNNSSDNTLSKKTSFYPYLNTSYVISEDLHLIAKGELSGGMQQIKLNESYRQNGWISGLNANTLNEKIGIEGSIEATPIKNLKAKIGLKYSTIQNFNYYVNDSVDLSYFTNSYVVDNVNLIAPSLELSYEKVKKLGASLMLKYNKYTASETLLHTPNLLTNVGIYYKLKNNLKLSSDISYLSGLLGSNVYTSKERELDSILDLSLKMDYKFNQKISAFIYANNLLSKKYVYYNYYQVQGVNFLGGLTVSF